MDKLFTQLALIFLCLSVTITARAHTGSIRGIISDSSTHKPVDGASIYIKEQNLSSVTDQFGKFFIKGLMDGKVTLYVTALGYRNSEQVVKIEDGVTTDLNIILTSS